MVHTAENFRRIVGMAFEQCGHIEAVFFADAITWEVAVQHRPEEGGGFALIRETPRGQLNSFGAAHWLTPPVALNQPTSIS